MITGVVNALLGLFVPAVAVSAYHAGQNTELQKWGLTPFSPKV
jgi:hypothetical protein